MAKYIVIGLAVAWLGAAANADWGHPVKWDQMSEGLDSYGAASWIDNDTPSDAITADDFLCGQTGYITEIELAGWSYYGIQYLDSFRVTFWSDVPATDQDASHPGELLYDLTLGPADPSGLGWKLVYDEGLAQDIFLINLPEDDWFRQERGTIYWVGIQGVMVNDNAFDAFYWNFRARTLPTWNDDAAFSSGYFGYEPWANWGSPPGFGDPALYDGPLPQDWTSFDMAFRLHGIPVPEPGLISLIGLSGIGAVALLRRKR